MTAARSPCDLVWSGIAEHTVPAVELLMQVSFPVDGVWHSNCVGQVPPMQDHATMCLVQRTSRSRMAAIKIYVIYVDDRRVPRRGWDQSLDERWKLKQHRIS
jgi:hypothetical protein